MFSFLATTFNLTYISLLILTCTVLLFFRCIFILSTIFLNTFTSFIFSDMFTELSSTYNQSGSFISRIVVWLRILICLYLWCTYEVPRWEVFTQSGECYLYTKRIFQPIFFRGLADNPLFRVVGTPSNTLQLVTYTQEFVSIVFAFIKCNYSLE